MNEPPRSNEDEADETRTPADAVDESQTTVSAEALPEDRLPPEDGSPPEAPAAPALSPPISRPRRRLYRSRTERMVSGLSGGMAEYFDVDPVLVRVGWVMLVVFTGGFAALGYFVGWMVVPEAPRLQTTGSLEHADQPETGEGSGFDAGAIADTATKGGGIAFGLILIGIGTYWMARTTGVLDDIEIDWGAGMAAALVAVGALLVLSGGRLARGLLIPLGVVLTVLLAGATSVNVNADGAFGERTERPTSVAQLEDDGYSQAFGSLTLDLRAVNFPQGTTRIEASTAFGSMDVRVPEGVAVRVTASTFLGSADVLGEETSGIASDREFETAGYANAPRRVELDISTAFGSVEVRR